MTQARTDDLDYSRNRWLVWLSAWNAPVAWFLQFQATYIFTPFVCQHPGLKLAHHVISLALLAVCIAGGLACRGRYKAAPEAAKIQPDNLLANPAEGRTRLQLFIGMASAALFALLILAQWSTVFFIDPCAF